jgi:hypothetical protein
VFAAPHLLECCVCLFAARPEQAVEEARQAIDSREDGFAVRGFSRKNPHWQSPWARDKFALEQFFNRLFRLARSAARQCLGRDVEVVPEFHDEPAATASLRAVAAPTN